MWCWQPLPRWLFGAGGQCLEESYARPSSYHQSRFLWKIKGFEVYREWECNVVNCSRLHSECERVSMPLTKASFSVSPILVLSCWLKWTSASFKALLYRTSAVYMMKPHPTCFDGRFRPVQLVAQLRRKARIRTIPRLKGFHHKSGPRWRTSATQSKPPIAS